MLKKLTRNVAPPIRNAAASATSTPDLPLPATCGLPECDPMAHAIAEIAIPATAATSPNVSRAPTMDSKEAMPGRPVRFGWMLTSLTNMSIALRVHLRADPADAATTGRAVHHAVRLAVALGRSQQTQGTTKLRGRRRLQEVLRPDPERGLT